MNNSDKAMKFIKGKFSARTPEIARHIRLTHKETDALLTPLVDSGELVTCSVTKDGRKMTEYRKVGIIF
jgi:hypothetical protein